MTDVETVAAIDCGTNAIRLLVADLQGDGRFTDRQRLMRIVRLGEGVDRTGEFSPAALERTFAAVEEYGSVIADEGVSRVRFIATSASRDVSNRQSLIDGVHARIGVRPEVISGDAEAVLSFSGAVRGLPAGLVPLPALVVDIGGGSTEFVLGSAAPESMASVDVGCVRMTERHLFGDPPTRVQIAAAEADIDAAVGAAAARVAFDQARCLVGLAGTVTTVAAMALKMDRYDAERLHGSVISAADVADVTERLLAMSRAERAVLPFMHPGRVDIIGGGAMVLRSIMDVGRFPSVIVSEADILDGIVYTLMGS